MVAITKHFKKGVMIDTHRWMDEKPNDVYFNPLRYLDGNEDRLEVLMELEGAKLGTVVEEWVTVWESK